MQAVWLIIAAVSVGVGIWATHFIAMLSFSAGMPTGYDLQLTLVSLAVAMCIVGGGLWFATRGPRRSDTILGGIIVGIGISAMHYIGMRALLIGGPIRWDPTLVSSSLLFGMGLGGAALYVGTIGRQLHWRLAGALLLTIGICSMHFTGMGAANLDECFPIVSTLEAAPPWLSLVIALVSVLILLLALGAAYLDLRDRRRVAAEADRMRGLADAAVEGLLVCRGDTIVTANRSFLDLVRAAEPDVAGRPLSDFLSASVCTTVLDQPNTAIETELRTGPGGILPVEVILRHVDFGGAPHDAVAIRDLSARKQAEQHIRFLAHHDPLTGLLNRASFGKRLAEEIAHAHRHNVSLSVLCLDVDRFKEVNDVFGHPAGDALLQRVGHILATVVEGRGVAARLGGDEFAVLLSTPIGADAPELVADSIIDALRRSHEAPGGGPPFSASIGISTLADSTDTAEQIMTQADTALYRAKRQGRGIHCSYELAMGAEDRDRRQLERDLRQALAQGELRLAYQPQLDTQNGAVTGFEALLRWKHPQRGEVSPARFVPIAEESGLILSIGEWVLRTACQEAAGWHNGLTVAVNVSAVQIHSPTFARTVESILGESGLAPERLEIEVTETALVRDIGRAIATLSDIRALGVAIAMDDFGTGYSSLANLRAFPFSKIKIDQSFVRSVDSNEQSAAIVRAVLGLGHGLKVPVVAEGVERQQELEFLRAEGCQSAQGYLIGRPADIASFAEVTERPSAIGEEALRRAV